MQVERDVPSELLRVIGEDLTGKVLVIDSCNLFILRARTTIQEILAKNTKHFLFNEVVVESNESLELTWDTSMP